MWGWWWPEVIPACHSLWCRVFSSHAICLAAVTVRLPITTGLSPPTKQGRNRTDRRDRYVPESNWLHDSRDDSRLHTSAAWLVALSITPRWIALSIGRQGWWIALKGGQGLIPAGRKPRVWLVLHSPYGPRVHPRRRPSKQSSPWGVGAWWCYCALLLFTQSCSTNGSPRCVPCGVAL